MRNAAIVVIAVGTGVYLFIGAGSERDASESTEPDGRVESVERSTPVVVATPAGKVTPRPSGILRPGGEKTASLRLSPDQHGVLEDDSGARMEVPQGALTVSISEVEPPPSSVKVGKVYDFSVGDSPILAPVTLHIPYELEPGADSSRIVPMHWDDDLEVWVVLEGEVDESSQTVAVTVLDLSWFTTAGAGRFR